MSFSTWRRIGAAVAFGTLATGLKLAGKDRRAVPASTGRTPEKPANTTSKAQEALIDAPGGAPAQHADPAEAVGETGRGRQADHPAGIPAPGWKDIVVRTWRGISSKNLGIVAAGTAFYSLLAIFPGLTALVSIYGLVADPSDVQSLVDLSGSVIPADANKLLDEQLKALIGKPSTGLSLAAGTALLLALWSSHSGMTTLMTAMNIAYGETERRGYIRRNLLALGLTIGAVLFIMVALSLVALLPAIIDFLPLSDNLKNTISLIRWPILIVMVMGALAAIYRLGPSRDQPQWKWVSSGAIIATILWVVGSAGFSIYVTRFGSYDKTYGSLGAVIVLLMWLYLTSYFILIGAELNAETEHQTVKDTTTGPPQPLGKRRALMADTVGEKT